MLLWYLEFLSCNLEYTYNYKEYLLLTIYI